MDRSGLVDRADLESDLLGGEALVDVDADRGCAVNAARLLRPPEKKLTGMIEIILLSNSFRVCVGVSSK